MICTGCWSKHCYISLRQSNLSKQGEGTWRLLERKFTIKHSSFVWNVHISVFFFAWPGPGWFNWSDEINILASWLIGWCIFLSVCCWLVGRLLGWLASVRGRWPGSVRQHQGGLNSWRFRKSSTWGWEYYVSITECEATMNSCVHPCFFCVWNLRCEYLGWP